MKKTLLILSIACITSAQAQNITENKVSFTYIQLPTNPIDGQYSTYDVMLEKGFEKSNEDSLTAYSMRVDAAVNQYDSEMAVWKEAKKNVDRNHLTAMAAWEKQIFAGSTTAVQPTKPPYPLQPVMTEVFEPRLHDDITNDQAKQAISLQGLNPGAGGAVITLKIMPVSGINIVETKSGEGVKTSYKYSCQYQMPIEIKVETPSQGAVLNTIILNSVKTYPMKSFASKYEYELWYLDNRDQFWVDLQKYARSEGLKAANTFINNACGYPTKTWSTEVYSVKKFKDFDYSDVTDAYTMAKQGYDLIYQERDRSAGHDKLQAAVSMWMKILEQSTPSDNKSRINDKVTAMCYYNIAEAYFWMNDFDASEQYINKAINAGTMKFKNAAKSLQAKLGDMKLRWNTNY